VIASLRDISLRTSHETSQDYENTVLNLLHRHFDALLVHSDPAICQLADYFQASARIDVPVFHTGVVAAAFEGLDPDVARQLIGADQYVVASTGGGTDRADLVARVLAAWSLLITTGRTGRYRLLIFSGLDGYSPAIRKGLEADPSIVLMGFDPDFRRWLQGAALSISCAGYNTCANLLVTRTPALLLPNASMSDQPERARLMSACGVALTVPPDASAEVFAEMIAHNLGRQKTSHSVRVDGAENSARFIERLVSGLACD
jgi:predicted glycosyltransferase